MADSGTAITWTPGETMHFEILVEDHSGKEALDILVPRIIGGGHTFRVHAYKGVGRIPPGGMRHEKDLASRLLLNNLPRLLRGYGKTFQGRADYPFAVIVVCDLDDKCRKEFRQELMGILDACDPKPETRFCIAVEEGEAWFLGDLDAVRAAFPRCKEAVLNSYENDSICGTWEKLADAVFPGGAPSLAAKGWQAVGQEKSRWAKAIAPRMAVENNRSPSFCYFRKKLLDLALPA